MSGRMGGSATPAELDAYRRDGFVRVRGALSSSVLRRWRDLATRAVNRKHAVPHSDREPEILRQIQNVWKADGDYRRLILDTRLGDFVASLCGLRSLRLWHDQILVKPPFAGPTPFHRDLPYWPFDDDRAVTVLIAIQDVNASTGCMHYAAGSHLLPVRRNAALTSGIGEVFNEDIAARALDIRPCEVHAGDLVIHSSRVIHGASANLSTLTRIVPSCSYFPDGTLYNGKRHPLLPTSFEVGCPLVHPLLPRVTS